MNAKLSPISELNGIIPSLHTPFNINKSIDLFFKNGVCKLGIIPFNSFIGDRAFILFWCHFLHLGQPQVI